MKRAAALAKDTRLSRGSPNPASANREGMPQTKKKRPSPLSLRLSDEAMALLADTKQRSGISYSAQVEEFVTGKKPSRKQRHPPVEKAMLGQMLGELAVIKQLAHDVALSGGDNCALLLEEIRDILIDIRNLIMRALGRRR